MVDDIRSSSDWRAGLGPDLAERHRAARALAEVVDGNGVEALLASLAEGSPDEMDLALRVLKMVPAGVFGTAERERWLSLTLVVAREHYFSVPLGSVAVDTLRRNDPARLQQALEAVVDVADQSDEQLGRVVDDLALARTLWSNELLRRIATAHSSFGPRVESILGRRGFPSEEHLARLKKDWRVLRDGNSLNALYENWLCHQVGKPAAPVLEALGKPDDALGGDYRYQVVDPERDSEIQLMILVSNDLVEAVSLQ